MTLSSPPAFDPLAIIRTLNGHGVRYVVIGGIAAGVQGAMWVTTDLDICHSRDKENLSALAAALTELDAHSRSLPADVRVPLDERALRAATTLTLATKYGALDLLAEPGGGLTYESLLERARWFEGEERYLVASLDDLIAMKRSAGRPKDAAHVELLEIAADEMKKRGER